MTRDITHIVSASSANHTGDADGEVESPCRAVCIYVNDAGLCSGCGRTLEEIAAWPGASASRKRGIVAAAAARLASFAAGKGVSD